VGTKFSIKEPNPGVWFRFDEDDPSSGRICIRVLNPAMVQEIDKATSKEKWEWRQGQKFKSPPDIDEPKRDRMLWDYCIVSWERLEDDDGKPLECTLENKVKLIKENPNFFAFVNACISELNRELEQVKDSIVKN
jgi:hypothetical protein